MVTRTRRHKPAIFIALLTVLASEAGLAQSVVEKHIEAIGGESALNKIKTLRRAGSVEIKGSFGALNGTALEYHDLANKKGSTSMAVPGFTQQTGWSDTSGWKKTSTEGRARMSDDELAFAKLIAGVNPVATLYREAGPAAFTDEGEKRFEGKDCAVLGVPDSPVRFYIDQTAHMLAGLEIEGALRVLYEGQKKTNGVIFPVTTTTEIPPQGITITTKLTKLEINAAPGRKGASRR